MTVATEPVDAVHHMDVPQCGMDAGEATRGEKRPSPGSLVTPPRNSPSNLRVLKYFLAAFFLAAASISVLAEDAAAPPAKKVPDFVPFVVDATQDAAARAYLNGLTFKDAAPLVAWLNELEARAKSQWSADNAPKEEKK